MSIKLIGVCAEVPEAKLLKKIEKIRKEFPDMDIRIHKNKICVEGDVKDINVQKRIDEILMEKD